MVEESKEAHRGAATQLTLDNFEEAEDEDPQYGHLTAHLVESAPRQGDNHQWSQVFTREEVETLQVAVHPLGPDLLYDKSLREAAAERTDLPGELVFSPTLFQAKDLRKDLAECEIPLDDLLGLGEVATKARQRFESAGRGAPADSSQVQAVLADSAESRSLQLKRKYERKARCGMNLTTATETYALRESVGRKKIKRHELSAAEVAEIVEAAKTLKWTHRDTAARFGVTEKLVSNLVVAARKDPHFLASLRKREEKRREKLRAVLTESVAQLSSKQGLQRVADV